MSRHAHHDILFEPIAIGPVIARNRFYQVPHCTGMGYALPKTVAAMREVKAQGGWGVVNTEYCSIHPSSDDGPYAFCTLWDEDDVRAQRLMTDAVHRYGALAGVELWHGGMHTPNRFSRVPPLSVSGEPQHAPAPIQSRAMDKRDIRNLRQWQVDAALRAKRAGFDIVYVYAGHDYLPFQFISRRHNTRGDEYGGSLENRIRLLKEMIVETKEAVGDTMGVAVRLAVDELLGPEGLTAQGEGQEVIGLLAELPDLWDVNVSDVNNDSMSARFSEEGFQEPYTAMVKALTTKPVVGVGRYTDPDRMASLIRSGKLDLIGAARPSIADPYLPNKVDEGRVDEIRECIGCNICRAGNNEGAPIRCTQNPTMGEEWRRGWHPEHLPRVSSARHVLIIGGGPAGLECARACGQRGFKVTLAEARERLGGRVTREATLPGLNTWLRVRDWRVGRIQQMPNVDIYLNSKLSAANVHEFKADFVVCATGSTWRADGLGPSTPHGLRLADGPRVVTPDSVLAGDTEIIGDVLVYDDDHYFMGGAMAERLALDGLRVSYMTPASMVSSWTVMTNEQHRIHARLVDVGVNIILNTALQACTSSGVTTRCVFTGRHTTMHCENLMLVTARQAVDSLYNSLQDADSNDVYRIGDCEAPGAIAHAVYSGHKLARELGERGLEVHSPQRERVLVRMEDFK